MTIPNIIQHIDAMFARGAKPRLARSIYASQIGHPCARCLVYDQLRVTESDPDSEPVFALGRTLERQAMIDLQEALAGTGIEIVEQQQHIPPNQYGIGGIIDLSVRYTDETGARRKVPAEFKSMSPFVFDSIDSVQDMKAHRSPCVQKYPAQLMIYMLMSNVDEGLFILRNKVTGRYKQIAVTLDYEYAETLLQRATLVRDAVAKHMAAKTDEEKVAALPARMPFDPAVCMKCQHYSACIPDPNTIPEADPRLWDVALDSMCARIAELKAAVDEREELMEQVKAHAKQLVKDVPLGTKRTTITDRFFVSAVGYETTAYKVPDEIRKQYETKSRAVRVDIARNQGHAPQGET